MSPVTPPLVTPRNDEADTLARVRCLEWSPATDVAHWLHRKLQHAGSRTMWQVSRRWGLPLKWQEIADACYDCSVCGQDSPQRRRLPWETQQIMRGRVPLTRWQVDYIGPLPKARNAIYAFIAVDTATGLMFAWPCPAADQRHTVVALTWLCALYGHPKSLKVTGVPILWGKKCSAGLPGWTCNCCFTPRTIHKQLA